jgi:hypothetical protein
MKQTILSILLAAITSTAVAQVTNEAIPRGWNLFLNETITPVTMPSFDKQAMLNQDAIDDAATSKPFRFANKFPVDLDLFNAGEWTVLQNGDRIWRLNIKSPGAHTMNFLMDRYDLPVGGELFIYNNDRSDKIGPYTYKENQEDGFLGTWIVYGDNIWLEYYEPKAVKNQGRIAINEVAHGYRGFKRPAQDGAKFLNSSGNCNVDVNCNPNQGSSNNVNWATIRDNYRNAVGLIIINGSGSCTGTLINNTNSDGTPYFLTADHCLGTSNGTGSGYPSSNWAFGFQWFTNTPDCATFANTVGPSTTVRVLSGATLRANDDIADFALFQINQLPPAAWNLYYAGWSRVLSSGNGQLGMHHPSGDIMKLARNDEAATPVSTQFNTNSQTRMWRISNWEYGVTEPGSSGSCLLNASGQIIGVLSGGSAACSGTNDNGGFDIYGRFDTSWNSFGVNTRRLSPWLDPINSDTISQDGSFAVNLTIASVATILKVNVYPNPSNGVFTVNVEESAAYTVYNLAGQVIQQGTFAGLTNQLDITAVVNGVYFLKVNSGTASATTKLVKE